MKDHQKSLRTICNDVKSESLQHEVDELHRENNHLRNVIQRITRMRRKHKREFEETHGTQIGMESTSGFLESSEEG